ncbi:MAG: hypothetical protein GW941_02610 [Candidatus Pacebacteria bacterium]|nr:hypothetical protein [Candidatus Paceibacterota bacterium]
MTERTLRKPQIVLGDMQPRNYYLGKETCGEIGDLIYVFREQGINLFAIPLFDEIEKGILEKSFKPGTVIGWKPPMNEKLEANVIVWDGWAISAISFMMFHRNQEEGWGFVSRQQDDLDTHVTEKKKKKSNQSHPEQKRRKERNGRRV